MAIDFIKNNFNIKDSKILPFSLLIVPLSYFFYKNNSPDKKQIDDVSQWFWKASLSNRFDSGIDTKIAEDITQFDKIISGSEPTFNYQYPFNTEKIKNQRLSTGSAFCKTILSLFAYMKPKNFKNGVEIDLNSAFSKYNSKEMHHFFPKGYLKKKGVDDEDIERVTNVCFQPFLPHREIGEKGPNTYLKEFKKDNFEIEETLKSHLIEWDFDSCLEDFDKFIEKRSILIEKKLRILAGLEKEDRDTSLITPKTPFSNVIAFRNVINSCEDYIYWLDKYFSERGLELISDFVDPKKIKKIKILMSDNKADDSFKRLFEDFREEMANKGSECELKIITDPKTKSDIHDRFIITKNKAYNIPSPDILARGQLSEISKSENRERLLKEFEKIWENSKEL